jgi:hypothetical protein
MPDDVQLRPATGADLTWVRDLARDESVAPSLSTTAADGLAGALAAGSCGSRTPRTAGASAPCMSPR